MITTESSLVDEPARVEGKAEIVDGKTVHLPMTGSKPIYAGDEIFVSLHRHSKQARVGRAVGDGKGFLVNLPHQKPFSPDVAYCLGPDGGMKFYPEMPIFAVEVRSEGDYGLTAEREMAAKRADCFASGTQAVWDVDLLSTDVVRVYHNDTTRPAAIYRRGDHAEAEGAVPGWTMPVDDLFQS